MFVAVGSGTSPTVRMAVKRGTAPANSSNPINVHRRRAPS
jgi:hypothetical protein